MFIKYTLIGLFLLVSPLINAAELTNLTPRDIQNKTIKDALVIDIRTPPEWQKTGMIPNSQPLTFFDKKGKYDTKKWLAEVKKLRTSPDQAIILVCQSGNRSGKVGHLLAEKLNMPHIYHLSSGMSSWVKEQLPTKKSCSALHTC